MDADDVLQRQVKEGIDAVIVDSVLAIRKGLTSGESAADTSNGTPVDEAEVELKLDDTKGQ